MICRLSTRSFLSLGFLVGMVDVVEAFAPTSMIRSTCSSSSSSSRADLVLYSTQLDVDAVERATQVFEKFDLDDNGTISSSELTTILQTLDIDASPDEADALFRYLDGDGDGGISLDDFLPWYSNAAEAAQEMASSFQALLIGRRTVDYFDDTPVSDDVLKRAIECAIAAPNRSRSEPWRFIQVGPATVAEFAKLNQQQSQLDTTSGMETDDDDDDDTDSSSNTNTYSGVIQPLTDWTKIPGWCVVTTKITSSEDASQTEVELEDFKSTSCAVQNFMLSMWSEGIGTKWTSGPVQKTPEFAKLCGVDTTVERVAGCIWYGFATGGLVNADPKRRRKLVDDVLTKLP